MKDSRASGNVRKRMIRFVRVALARPKWRRSKPIRWSIGIGLTLTIAVLFPSAHTIALSGYAAGSLWTNSDVTAPFTFPIYKEGVRYTQDVRKALQELHPVYVPDTNAASESVKHFHRDWEHLMSMLASAREDSLAGLSLLDSAKAIGLTKDDWVSLVSSAQSESQKQFERDQHDRSDVEAFIIRQIAEVESMRLITSGKPEEAASESRSFVLRTRPNEESLMNTDSLLTVQAVANRIYSKLEARLKHDTPLLHPLSVLLSQTLLPTVTFDAGLTEESRQAIIERVPRTDGLVIEGQKIVEKGEVLTPQMVSSLESLSKARLEQGGSVAELWRILGTIGHAGLIVMLIVLYLKFIRRKIYNDNAQILLIALVLLFPAVMAYFSVSIPVDFPLQYFILIPVASMLLTILFDSRTGFYGTVAAALLVAGIRGNDYSVALAGLCAGAFAAYTVRDLRNRGQLFTSIGYIFAGYLVAIVALSLEQGTPPAEAGAELISALGNALVSPVITLGLLYVIEMLFDTASDLRLTEFDNVNLPLLRELALQAPGTYQHTMMVAQLAEHAALAVGANALLAKIGAYFHDIGKLTDPQTFVENQGTESGNIHDMLSARESARRVKAHVAQGVILARANGLPERIIDFIPMHHGTLPISFFYLRAVTESLGDSVINEDEFRYTGPLPNSKETVIVMLADASEAISRSLARKGEETSFEAIDEAIGQLIRTRFEQGQFDQSDITVRDFMIIRAVFARHLSGLHHPRIPYPSREPEDVKSVTA